MVKSLFPLIVALLLATTAQADTTIKLTDYLFCMNQEELNTITPVWQANPEHVAQFLAEDMDQEVHSRHFLTCQVVEEIDVDIFTPYLGRERLSDHVFKAVWHDGTMHYSGYVFLRLAGNATDT